MTESHEKSNACIKVGDDLPCNKDVEKAILEDEDFLMTELDDDEDNVDESANTNYMEIATSFIDRTVKVVIEKINIFPCKKCPKVYMTNRELQVHIVKHIKNAVLEKMEKVKKQPVFDNKFEKKYKCEFCTWRFVCSSTLTAHMQVHDPLPHVCHCGIGYYYEEDLEEHEKIMHRLQIEKVDRRRINQGPWVAKINLKSNKPTKRGKKRTKYLSDNNSDDSFNDTNSIKSDEEV